MKIYLGSLILIFLCISNHFAQNLVSEDCSILLLTKKGDEINLERHKLLNNTVEVIPISEKDENISIILFYAPGISGDFVKLKEKKMMITRCEAGNLKIKIRKEDGAEKELPILHSINYENYSLRVNITGKTVKKAFKVFPHKEIEQDKTGPVIDMFGGKIPIGDNDYSITVEAAEQKLQGLIKGETPLEYDKYLFVKAKTENGKERDFVVDFAAAQSIIVKNILPQNAKLTEAKSIEYSENGKRIVDYAAGGAGGMLKELMFTKLDKFEIGNVKFANQSFLVMDSLPKLAGREIGGIIGLDILKQSAKISFSYPQNSTDKTLLVFSDVNINDKKEILKVPFSIVFNHIYLRGKIEDENIEFVLDTGSPDSIINTETANLIKIEEFEDIQFSIKGLDGNPITAKKSNLSSLKLGDLTMPNFPIIVADLPIFQQRGISKTGLLGNSFLKKFSRIELDFENKNLNLVK